MRLPIHTARPVDWTALARLKPPPNKTKVPGSVAGFHHALMNYGTLSWEEVLKPAI